jgi:hypothetical protein
MIRYEYNSYDEYLDAQRAGFEEKKEKIWASEENIKFLARYLDQYFKRYQTTVKGLCHGVRTGAERRWFMQYGYGFIVYGTDIGDSQDPMTFKWDFNQYCQKFRSQFDFIYSNAFDHAFNPRETLSIWMGQLRKRGFIILEWSAKHEHTGEAGKSVDSMDPIGISLDELLIQIPQWVPGACIADVLDLPVVKKDWHKAIIIGAKKGWQKEII